MREIQKMCRICLGQGSRQIFENSSNVHLMGTNADISRFAEKLRFVTMLKVNPKENLPQQICDLCIVQLNVSYNFKRLALKNDFHMRNYMIENGMSLTKDDDQDMDSTTTTTALEIHQIQHNVIRTNRYRQIAAPELRRNSTTSSVSGTSMMIVNGRESEVTPNNSTSTFVTPKPATIRPIQIKTEPIDPDEAQPQQKEASPTTSSPSTSLSEPSSIVTVHSSNPPSSSKASSRPPPMIVINGLVNNDSFAKTSPKKPQTKLGRPPKSAEKKLEKPREAKRDLRTIKKKSEEERNVRKVREVMKEVAKRSSGRNITNNALVRPRAAKTKAAIKSNELGANKDEKKQKKQPQKPPPKALRGRPGKAQQTKIKIKFQNGKRKL